MAHTLFWDVYNFWPLHSKGHSDIVRLLVNLCDVEASSTMEITPLYVAAHYGQVECLQILINAGNLHQLKPTIFFTKIFIGIT